MFNKTMRSTKEGLIGRLKEDYTVYLLEGLVVCLIWKKGLLGSLDYNKSLAKFMRELAVGMK